MCIIVDANVCSEVFGNSRTDRGEAVLKWLFFGNGRLVYAGKLAEELSIVASARNAIQALMQAGQITACATSLIDADIAILKSTGKLVSNDDHIIALARCTGCRRLFSDDQNAIKDFKNNQLVKKPSGKVYRDVKHTKTVLHRTNVCAGTCGT